MAKFNWSPWTVAVAAKSKEARTDEAVGLPGSRLSVRQGQYAWVPGVDVYESASGVTVTVDLPGLTREDVALHVEGRGLVITGERRMSKEPEEGVFHTLERPFGQFSRRIELPEGLDLAATKAVLREGVLSVSVPRAPSAGSRRISVDE